MLQYRYINHDELAALIKSSGKKGSGRAYQIVDVRDEDFAGGNIVGAINAPSDSRTQASIEKLVEDLKDVPKVIFHCSLSQVRGPKTARIYAETLAASKATSVSTPSSSSTSTRTPAEAARTFSPNPYPQAPAEGEQEVLVLRDGFKNFQALYRNDPLLVENWDADAWKEYTPWGVQGY